MIGYIKGQIIDQDDRFVIVLAGNVGYKVNVTEDTILSYKNKPPSFMEKLLLCAFFYY
jgi:Holliday junction resolvasome RuvABC DNA-binding subunit